MAEQGDQQDRENHLHQPAYADPKPKRGAGLREPGRLTASTPITIARQTAGHRKTDIAGPEIAHHPFIFFWPADHNVWVVAATKVMSIHSSMADEIPKLIRQACRLSGNPVHKASVAMIVIHWIMQSASVVPEGDVSCLPNMAAQEFRPDLMRKQIG